MKTRTAVLLASIGAVIAAVILVVMWWPELPTRTLPAPVAVAPPAKAGCLAPMIDSLRARAGWSLRIDDMRWTDYTQPPDDPKHASIVLDASGGTWRSAWLHAQTLPLAEDEVRDVLAAFDRSCEVDAPVERAGFEGRYINLAYERDAPASARLPSNSHVVLRLGALFEAIRARYVASHAAAARTFTIKLSGLVRSGPKEWSKHALAIDAAQLGTDEERVDFVDWARSLPAHRPPGKLVATGTFTVGDVTSPIAVSLDASAEENRILHRIANELSIWMSINRE